MSRKWIPTLLLVMGTAAVHAQSPGESEQNMQAMQQRIETLENEVQELQAIVKGSRRTHEPEGVENPTSEQTAATAQPNPSSPPLLLLTNDDRKELDFLHGTTINVALDGYYTYNFNHPVGRVNLLRAYDVLSNEFSLNQASIIFEHAPNVAAGQRFGGRLDLQFGQATATIQGNPANEPRPDIYRNLFQVYGSYVAPIGKGVNIDFGKWASSLGIEGNYTKDQLNYSRSYWFYFLPFYHMGIRASFPINERFAINYWLVNGINQVEATKAFKDELFGFTAQPYKTVNWTANYYLGQEHPDVVAGGSGIVVPTQPGLGFVPIRPAADGRTHIFDTYATWQPTPKLTLQAEADYLVQRLWRNAAPGRSSAPAHTAGGAAYVRYQFNPKFALATRAEYMADQGALFSGISQALKENTITFDFKLSDDFLMRYEWRIDYSNQPTFLTDVPGLLANQQTTASVGLTWWWGRKQGPW